MNLERPKYENPTSRECDVNPERDLLLILSREILKAAKGDEAAKSESVRIANCALKRFQPRLPGEVRDAML